MKICFMQGMNQREWKIDKDGLTLLQKTIAAVTEAFKGLLRLAASA